MKIAVIVLWGLTFATFLTLLVCLPSLRCLFLLLAVLFALAAHYLLSKLRWAFNP